MISLCELSKKLKSETNVALFCHIRPDGDCLGSAHALALALKSIGIKVKVFCEDAIPERFWFLKETKDVQKEIKEEFSALVAIDCGDITRLGIFAPYFSEHKNTFNIDHHTSNNHYAKYNYVQIQASNAENIYDLICEMDIPFTKDIANYIAMGVMTDTGNFRHKSLTPKTFLVASKMLEQGADINKINYYMFSAQTDKRAKLFGMTMDRIRYFHDRRFAVASILLSDLEKSGAKPDETEGFIDFVMGIKGVEVGACVLEIKKDKFKISFRSREVDVNAVASRFGGGGHILASGCQIAGEYEEVIDKICFAVSRELKD